MIKLIDTKVRKLVPEIRVMTKAEHINVFPDNKTPRSINLVVKYNIPIDIEKALRGFGYSEKDKMRIAGFFIKKYPSMKFVKDNLETTGSKDDLDEMKYRDLQHLLILMTYDKPELELKPVGMKRDEVIANIRKLREKGVTPLSEEDYLKLKEKKEAEHNKKAAEAARAKYAAKKIAEQTEVREEDAVLDSDNGNM